MFSASQYQAVRGAAGLIDRSLQGKLALSGSDRRSYLHALLTNDILALKPGTGCYAAYLTPQGRMLADMRVLELGDRILLDVPPSVTALVGERLDQLIFSEDVQVMDVTRALGEFGVHGPRSAEVLAAATKQAGGADQPGLTFEGLEQYENVRVDIRGVEAVIVREDSFGEMGFDVYIDQAHAAELRAAIVAAGAAECGAETAEVLRIEAGRPLFGVDMDDDTIPLEAGIEDRAMSFTKGCYVGQEVIVRIQHRGHGRIARRLVGLVVEGAAVPGPKAVILDGARRVGHVTSAVLSPAVGGPIALGYVQRDYWAPGTELTITQQDRALRARVAAVPFMRRT